MEKNIRLCTHDEAKLLFGPNDQNTKSIEKQFKVKITVRNEHLKIKGAANNIKKSASLIESILGGLRNGNILGPEEVKDLISGYKNGSKGYVSDLLSMPSLTCSSAGKRIGPRTKGQQEYVQAIRAYDIVFGIGPAGTGKTYLAMAAAVEALKKHEVRRIILTRPAIEAGESLGFLPGDMVEKISPYLRPLYDAMYDMMDAEVIEKYLETGIVEVAPLAYMRGRTLNEAFIILDEAQNCTAEQMKMFLTRLGFDSKAVITGDITQSDLPEGRPVGLLQAQDILSGIEGIKFIRFSGLDVVRHALVQRIIEAYDKTSRNK
ncbi:MAG: PhoH family protein [Candidatus Omnitrophota bacterium]|jgi:phosphate starvation-inducible PhoH-like protein|nr:MAG: PhoH family protein [Candidatus Omnitrophota bacterium]